MSAAAVARVVSVAESLAVAPRVMVPGQDVAATSAEDAVGHAMAEALAESGAAWAHLQNLRGRVAGVGQQLAVAIDADEAVRGLPWELLSLGDGSVEGVEGGLVVRFANGPAQTPAQRPSVALLAADTDPEAARLLEAAREQVKAAGLSEVSLSDGPAVVHVVAHGQKGAGTVAVAFDDGIVHPGTLSARLGQAAATAHLVILGVCHGASDDVDALSGVAGRLLASGAALVVAPRRAVATEAVERLSGGIYETLGAGHSAGAAVAAGRRALRAWGHPHPSCRWWSWACWTSGVDALAVAPRPLVWMYPGWPVPSPEAGVWLDAARVDAIKRGDGYLGVDHLLRAFADIEGGGRRTSELRRRYEGMLGRLTAVSDALFDQHPPTTEPVLSPRVAAWGSLLEPSFQLGDLASLILGIRDILEGMDHAPPGVETLFTDDSETGTPALALQVIGGPEDGRILRPRVGDTIGRAGGKAKVRLFDGTRFTDRKLSRLHCRWLGSSTVLLERSSVVVRGTARHRLVGEVELRAGDMLILSEATRLFAMGDQPSD